MKFFYFLLSFENLFLGPFFHPFLFIFEQTHCVKSVRIRSFFRSVFFRIRIEYGQISPYSIPRGKIRTRKNSLFGHFSRSDSFTFDLYCFDFMCNTVYKVRRIWIIALSKSVYQENSQQTKTCSNSATIEALQKGVEYA